MKKIYFTFIVFLFMVFQVKAQWEQLSHPLLEGAEVQTFSQTGSTVFASIDGGIFITQDMGLNWYYRGFGIDSSTNRASDLVNFNNNIYASVSGGSSTVYMTSDYGITWTEVITYGIPTQNGNSFGLGSANNKLFRFFQKWNGQNADSIFVYYSNNGTAFTHGLYLGPNVNYSNSPAFLPLNRDKAIIWAYGNLFYTTDGITKTQLPLPDGLSYVDEDRLNSEPNGNYIFYYDEQTSQFFRLNLTVLPLQWEDITANILNSSAQIISAQGSDGVILATAFSDAGLKFYRSVDHGTTFDTIPIASTGLTIPVADKLWTVSPNNLIADILGNYIYYSADNGTSWTKRSTGFLGHDGSNLVESNGKLLSFQKQGSGVIRSDDNGQIWYPSDTGLPSILNELYFINGLFKVNGVPYVMVQNIGPNMSLSKIFKSTNDGQSWDTIFSQPVSEENIRLNFLGKNGNQYINTFFVSSTTNNGTTSVYRTTNGGNSWTNITNSLTIFINEFYGFLGKGDSLFAAGRNNSTGYDRILLSTNNGNNWQVSADIPNGNIKRVQGDEGLPVAEYGGSPNRWLAVIRDYGTSNGNDIIYTVSNWQWTPLNPVGLPGNAHIYGIKFMDGRWYLATTCGVFRSGDAKIWEPVNNQNFYLGMIGSQMQMIDNLLFLGTYGNGIWVNDLLEGTEDLPANDGISVYPNPAGDKLFIQFKDKPVKNMEIELSTIEGKCVYKQPSPSENKIIVNVGHLSEGIYFLKLTSAKGQIVKKITVGR